MAAGLTIRKDAFDEFKELFARAVKELSDPEMFERNIVTDGELRASDFNIELVEAIRKHVWGQAFLTGTALCQSVQSTFSESLERSASETFSRS